jgi:uncharacterized delta-60 repeat protein
MKKISLFTFSLLVGVILLNSAVIVKAAGGDLDTSFDSSTGADGAVHATVIQDGKIIIGGGFTSYNGAARRGIARLNADGSLDTSFDPGTGANSVVETVAVTTSGLIIIGGSFTSYNGIARAGIARLNYDGSLETSFNPGTGISSGSISSMVLLPDWKIIIGGGFSSYNGTARRNIARLNADGSLDTTFDPGTGTNDQIFTTVIQPDGKILIGGQFTTYNGTTRNCIARLNVNGSLDNTFVSMGFYGFADFVDTIVVQPDGKIIAGGSFRGINNQSLNITRFNADGSVDTTFHPGVGTDKVVYTVVLQPDGKIFLGGGFASYNNIYLRNNVVRINADGSIDTTFNPGSGADWNVRTAVLQADGKIIIGGDFGFYNGTSRGHVARLQSSPSLISFSAATYPVSENAVTAIITVNRTGGSFGAVAVNYATSDGTATAGVDYNSTSGTLSFADGETMKSFAIFITNDSLTEANETVNLGLSIVTGYAALGAQSTAVLAINDDDSLPSISINDISIAEGNSGQKTVVFSVSLSAISPNQITVQYSTSEGTATNTEDYMGGFGGILFGPNQASAVISVPINGDTLYEPDETFFVNLSNPTNAVIVKAQGVGTILNDDVPNMQFTKSNYTVNEGAGSAAVVVTRGGDLSGAATVNYATSDTAGLQGCNVFNGIASSRCDYATTVGVLRFAANESTKTIFIPIVDDGYVDGVENFTIKLSAPTGTILGSNSTATVGIFDNDFSPSNPIVEVPFFVRQQYIDFLGREPDGAGNKGWQSILNNCPASGKDANGNFCDRTEVSAGFFRSPEFQDRGYFIYRFYSAVGKIPLYETFMPDFAKVSGFLSTQELEANKVAFVNEFMTRSDYQNLYGSITGNNAYVTTLLSTLGWPNHPRKAEWVTALNNGTTRAVVLRAVTEDSQVYQKYYTEAFVIMQYFGYLRRSADISYLQWIQTMNSNGGDYRVMIDGFLNSAEYRQRFGQ